MKNSQLLNIAEDLVRCNFIGPIIALNKYGCYRLAARIKDLRDMGWKIETERFRKSNGKLHTMYRLISAGAYPKKGK